MAWIFAMVKAMGQEDKQLFSKYKIAITQNLEKEQEKLPSEQTSVSSFTQVADSVVLFFSFDIVNSSMYKTVNYYGWSSVIHMLIVNLRNKISEQIPRAELWRVFGDEVVFIVTICDMESIYAYTEAIYDVLIKTIEEISNGEFFNCIQGLNPSAINLMKIQNVISLKACAWIAAVTNRKILEQSGYISDVENIFEVFEEKGSNKFYEFLGRDIDAGFRLSKETRDKRLVLSFELAYLLSQKYEYKKDRLYIISYRTLKGIWGEKLYPVIWYYDKNKNCDRKFENSIPFDAIENDDLYREYFENRNGNKRLVYSKSMLKYPVFALTKILEDRKLEYKINKITEIITNSENNYSSFIYSPLLEMHCVAVCYNTENEGILIVKRTNRKRLNNYWEFGCAKANAKKNLIESIFDDYKSDFGIEIELFVDSNRTDAQPIPLAVYQVPSGDEMHKGVIFLAKIHDPENITLNKDKHSEYKYLLESDINTFSEESVQDFSGTLKLAFNKINELRKDTQNE